MNLKAFWKWVRVEGSRKEPVKYPVWDMPEPEKIIGNKKQILIMFLKIMLKPAKYKAKRPNYNKTEIKSLLKLSDSQNLSKKTCEIISMGCA